MKLRAGASSARLNSTCAKLLLYALGRRDRARVGCSENAPGASRLSVQLPSAASKGNEVDGSSER